MPSVFRAAKTAWIPSLPLPATASPSRIPEATGRRSSGSHASRGGRIRLTAGATEDSGRPMVADVDLRPLAVELRLGNVAWVHEPPPGEANDGERAGLVRQ